MSLYSKLSVMLPTGVVLLFTSAPKIIRSSRIFRPCLILWLRQPEIHPRSIAKNQHGEQKITNWRLANVKDYNADWSRWYFHLIKYSNNPTVGPARSWHSGIVQEHLSNLHPTGKIGKFQGLCCTATGYDSFGSYFFIPSLLPTGGMQ